MWRSLARMRCSSGRLVSRVSSRMWRSASAGVLADQRARGAQRGERLGHVGEVALPAVGDLGQAGEADHGQRDDEHADEDEQAGELPAQREAARQAGGSRARRRRIALVARRLARQLERRRPGPARAGARPSAARRTPAPRSSMSPPIAKLAVICFFCCLGPQLRAERLVDRLQRVGVLGRERLSAGDLRDLAQRLGIGRDEQRRAERVGVGHRGVAGAEGDRVDRDLQLTRGAGHRDRVGRDGGLAVGEQDDGRRRALAVLLVVLERVDGDLERGAGGGRRRRRPGRRRCAARRRGWRSAPARRRACRRTRRRRRAPGRAAG